MINRGQLTVDQIKEYVSGWECNALGIGLDLLEGAPEHYLLGWNDYNVGFFRPNPNEEAPDHHDLEHCPLNEFEETLNKCAARGSSEYSAYMGYGINS